MLPKGQGGHVTRTDSQVQEFSPESAPRRERHAHIWASKSGWTKSDTRENQT
jgi:hypothetical protein